MPATATTTPTLTRRVRYVPEPARSAAPATCAPPSNSWGGPFGVLLVEDNDDEAVMVQHTLKRAGLTDRPHVVRDGHEALDALLGPKRSTFAPSPLADVPDVILLDLGLPKISGLHVLRTIKENARVSDIPVVVLSGTADEVTAQVCMDLGANMYIIKPISYVEALNIIVAVQKHWVAAENFRAFDTAWSERRAA